MRIAVNVQTLVKNHLEGLGWFAFETLKRITRSHPEHEFVFIFGKGVHDEFIFSDNVKAINIGPPFLRPFAWKLKFNLLLPLLLKKIKADIYVSTDGFSNSNLKIKNLLVIHDLNFEENKNWLQKSFARYYLKSFPNWAKNANRIATVSEYSKQDISRKYSIDKNIIDVVYNGSNSNYKPLSDSEKVKTKQEYANGNDYFVFVGNVNPRKNLLGLLKAFELFKSKTPSNINLIVVGAFTYNDNNITRFLKTMKFKEDVIFTGHLQKEELRKVMGSSLALCYVSLFEGFGIPIIEAMNCETAVITSNITSMPEVAGDAAILVDPSSVESISDAMKSISSDKNSRKQLIEKGKIQRDKFSWDKTAENLWSSIEKVINE